jgi:hypothetical protein
MKKYLATIPLTGEDVALQVVIDAQKNYFFAGKTHPKACFVTPYFIVTDGKDILCYDNENGEVEIGFTHLIPKPNKVLFRKNTDLFDSLVKTSIKERFNDLFPEIKTTTINREGNFQQSSLPDKFIHVHPTTRGGYSLDRKNIYIFYFVVLPNTRLVKLIPGKNTPVCISESLKDFTRIGLAKYKLSFISQAALVMIGLGEIITPIISESSEDTRLP